MFLHRSFVPGLAIYSYMVGDEASGRCAIIDPTRDVEPYMRLAREQGSRITDILETHVHADFAAQSSSRRGYRTRRAFTARALAAPTGRRRMPTRSLRMERRSASAACA